MKCKDSGEKQEEEQKEEEEEEVLLRRNGSQRQSRNQVSPSVEREWRRSQYGEHSASRQSIKSTNSTKSSSHPKYPAMGLSRTSSVTQAVSPLVTTPVVKTTNISNIPQQKLSTNPHMRCPSKTIEKQLQRPSSLVASSDTVSLENRKIHNPYAQPHQSVTW